LYVEQFNRGETNADTTFKIQRQILIDFKLIYGIICRRFQLKLVSILKTRRSNGVMNKILLTIVCFFCLSLISNLVVADKLELADKPDWLEAKEFAKKKEKELLDAESALNKAKTLAEQKEKELLDSVNALEEAKKLAEQKKEELLNAESSLEETNKLAEKKKKELFKAEKKAKKLASKAEKRRLKSENKAKKLAKKKQHGFLEAESALNEAKKLAEQKEEELRRAEILLIREDYDMPPKN
jgi:hypothetical protein